ncbi:tail sheath stabilizer [Acidovorax phage ACP17]|uniref:Tail sheath stabilizer and completion protein n=1 Tax=Acidovorax phage ACP17 TaxID=2010329 RepID=A0A218M2V3_9CAUD|nr:tail sheath stabilizer [Acidovorax phage ACP17]ASD50369.1 hypothetical protein [Acidovorax phage ACP17]
MLGFSHYYWATTKKVIVAFGSIFDNLTIEGDHGDELRVPLYYSPREKFIDNRKQNPDIESTAFDLTFPAMGFEITGVNFAPERHLNPLRRIQDRDGDEKLASFNRVPYDITFSLTVGARRFEESLRIVEQIFPFFTPELTMTFKDREDFDLDTNVSFTLNSTGLNMPYEGTYDERRTILWDLQFTAKTFYYAPVQRLERIKQTVMDLRSMEFDRRFEALQSTVVPRTARVNDPHVIEEKVLD